MKTLLSLLGILLLSVQAQAQQYWRDSSFNSNGLVPVYSFPTTAGIVARTIGVFPQANGNIVLVNASQNGFQCMRLKPNGSVDATYGTNGSYFAPVQYPTSAFGFPDGSVVVSADVFTSGSSYSNLYRINAGGQLDASFGNNGVRAISPYNTYSGSRVISSLPNGQMIVGGFHIAGGNLSHYFLTRLKANGQTDNTFGTNGLAESVFPQLQNNNSRIEVGTSMADGRLVSGFLGHYTPGYNAAPLFMVRYKANGKPDSTFGQNGLVTHPMPFLGIEMAAVKTLPDSSVLAVVIGNNDTAAQIIYIIKFKYSGKVDSAYGLNGIMMLVPNTLTFSQGNSRYVPVVLLQPDGRLLLASHSDTGVARRVKMLRLTAKGVLDTSFGNSGTLLLPPHQYSNVITTGALQPNDQILLGGGFNPQVVTGNPFTDTSRPMCYRLKPAFSPNAVAPVAFQERITLFPNPAGAGGIYITVPSSAGTPKSARLLNAVGQSIMLPEPTVTGQQWHVSPPAAIAPGMYYLELRTQSGTRYLEKVLLQ